jgi:hypothetical protein
MSNANKIEEYFRRQYEVEEGTVEENLAALFAEDLVYHLGDRTVGREALIETATKIRSSPQEGRVAAVSDLEEDGDTVTFHMSLNVRGLAGGEDIVLESDNTWRFNSEGKVVEASPAQIGAVEDAFRAAGVDPEGDS